MAAASPPKRTVPKSTIYTRTGDQGTTLLYSGDRVSKTDPTIRALGAIDSLNASLGLAAELLAEAPQVRELVVQVQQIQSTLIELMASVATPRSTESASRLAQTVFDESGARLRELEGWIDVMDAQLPPLTQFILPGGGPSAAALHVARADCRQAERAVVELGEGETIEASVGAYLNRLSDYLFVAARYSTKLTGRREVVFKSRRRRNSSISAEGVDQLALRDTDDDDDDDPDKAAPPRTYYDDRDIVILASVTVLPILVAVLNLAVRGLLRFRQ